MLRIPKKSKPHIYYRRGQWVCRDNKYHGRAAKPVTAYRDYDRNKKWVFIVPIIASTCPGNPAVRRSLQLRGII